MESLRSCGFVFTRSRFSCKISLKALTCAAAVRCSWERGDGHHLGFQAATWMSRKTSGLASVPGVLV